MDCFFSLHLSLSSIWIACFSCYLHWVVSEWVWAFANCWLLKLNLLLDATRSCDEVHEGNEESDGERARSLQTRYYKSHYHRNCSRLMHFNNKSACKLPTPEFISLFRPTNNTPRYSGRQRETVTRRERVRASERDSSSIVLRCRC